MAALISHDLFFLLLLINLRKIQNHNLITTENIMTLLFTKKKHALFMLIIILTRVINACYNKNRREGK
ncbi:hypothetical protein A8L34_22605 [Bacillus sp. FJAT-27264]|nr:hypothetical protein A8L34_22605 [Bacillus sp. FJAT-27264]